MNKKAKLTLLGSLSGAVGMFSALVSLEHVLFTKLFAGAHEIRLTDKYKDANQKVNDLQSPEIWGFTSFDKLKLKAHFYPALTEDSHLYAICVHGYQGAYTDVMAYCLHYLENGYNVLLPHLRGHGMSEGNYAGFGYHDHYDLCGFIDLIREKDPQAKIVLHGHSMGAATVMMTAGEQLPSCVICAIEDAGYTDAEEQLLYNMKQKSKLPASLILNMTDLMVQAKYHYSIKDCTPIESVTHASVPIFFVHGDADTLVPYSMLQPLYDACVSEKEILTIPGARHVNSVLDDPETYWQRIDAFIARFMNKE